MSGCTGDNAPGDRNVVAEIGDRTVTQEDFNRAYAFAPSSVKQGTPQSIKAKLLEGMIEEKLFAIAAEQEGLLQDSWVQKRLQYQEDREIVRELYRKKVRDNVTVSQAEIDSVFELKSYEIDARHLFAREKSTADSLYRLLQQGASFYELSEDVFTDPKLADTGGDLGTVTWGDLDENLEKVLFRMPVGVISEPVESRFGYHILRVDNRAKQVFQTVNTYINESQTVETILRRRKERERAHQFIRETMEPMNVTMKGPPFWTLVDAIWEYFRPHTDTLKGHLKYAELEFLRKELEDYRDAPLVTSAKKNWTLAEVLELYQRHPMEFSAKSHSSLAASLKNIIGILTRDDYLADIGREMGLEKSSKVRETKQQWMDRLLADRFKQVIFDTLAVSQELQTEFGDTHSESPEITKQAELRNILKQKITALRDQITVKINQENLNEITLPDEDYSRRMDFVGVWQQ